MALVIADRVKEATTSTSLGAFLVTGAENGYATFASKCSIGDTFYYVAVHRTLNEWECGLAEYEDVNELARQYVLAGSNGTSFVDFSAGTKDVFITMPAKQVKWIREVVTEYRGYFVSKTGSDSNDGLTSGTAFLTIGKAVRTITETLALNDGAYIGVAISAGTYAEHVVLPNIVGSSSAPVSIYGEAGVTVGNGNGGITAAGQSSNWAVGDLTLASGVLASGAARLELGNVSFSSAANGTHIRAESGAYIYVAGDVAISANANAHAIANDGRIYYEASITITGTPAFSYAFAAAESFGGLNLSNATVSGAATGKRYIAETAGVIVAGENDPLPGSIAGTTATGGAYHT